MATNWLTRAPHIWRTLRRIEERFQAAEASGDEAALTRLTRHLKANPQIEKAINWVTIFGQEMESETELARRLLPPGIERTPDIDKMMDVQFFLSIRNAVRFTPGGVARARSSEGGTRGGSTNAMAADTKWRREAKRLANQLSSKRPYSQRQLAKQVWSRLPPQIRPAESSVRAYGSGRRRYGAVRPAGWGPRFRTHEDAEGFPGDRLPRNCPLARLSRVGVPNGHARTRRELQRDDHESGSR
jgi:hypothetical protein